MQLDPKRPSGQGLERLWGQVGWALSCLERSLRAGPPWDAPHCAPPTGVCGAHAQCVWCSDKHGPEAHYVLGLRNSLCADDLAAATPNSIGEKEPSPWVARSCLAHVEG